MSNWNINGQVSKDNAYSNFAVDNTSVVRGKQTVQEQDAVTLNVADTATIQNLIVLGDQEIDGTLAVKGVAQFDSAVSIPVTQTELTLDPPTEDSLTGSAYIIRQNNVVTLTYTLTDDTTTIAAAYIPSTGAPGSTMKINATTGDVTVSVATVAWSDGTVRTATVSWVALQ